MKDSIITTLIKRYTKDDRIDLKKICESLGVTVKADSDLDDYARIARDQYGQATIWLNPKVESKTRFTLIVIALAEFLLHPERIKGKGITYDMFSLQDLNRKKHSPYMLLATRLAVPEHIIEKIIKAEDAEFSERRFRTNAEPFDVRAYIEHSIFLPQFIRCVVKESTGKMILENVVVKML